MRRAASRLLARAVAGRGASTSGRSAGFGGGAGADSAAGAATGAAPWPASRCRLVLAGGGRGFAALPAAGRRGPSPPPPPPPSVSGHAREVTAADIGVPAAVQTARDVLHHASLVHFRETLEHESETRLSMPYGEALALAKACGVATTEEEAAAALAAAHSAGLVLRFQGTVFLRPSEVADLVLRALPDTDLEVRGRLAALEAQLAPLEAQKRSIDAAARRRSRRVLWAGLGVFAGQCATFVYLTFHHPEWGWDATEPFTYFAGQALTIGGLSFYLYARRPLEPGEVEKHVADGAVKAGVAAHGFDAAAHARLASDVARYRRYLERQASHAEGG